jgi:hypothetical protein
MKLENNNYRFFDYMVYLIIDSVIINLFKNHFIKQLLRLKINLSQFKLKENNISVQAINKGG